MQVREENGVVIAVIDPEAGAKLWPALEPYIQAGRRAYVLDLAGIAYLNSVAIAALISARNKLVALGHRATLANLSPTLQNVFRVLRLERLFDLGHDLPAAVKAAAG